MTGQAVRSRYAWIGWQWVGCRDTYERPLELEQVSLSLSLSLARSLARSLFLSQSEYGHRISVRLSTKFAVRCFLRVHNMYGIPVDTLMIDIHSYKPVPYSNVLHTGTGIV